MGSLTYFYCDSQQKMSLDKFQTFQHTDEKITKYWHHQKHKEKAVSNTQKYSQEFF